MPIPIRKRGYPHSGLLAETDWLAGRLSDPMVRVVDARSDKDYASGHIPGAVHINGFSLGGIRPEPEMPEPEAFAQLVGEAWNRPAHTSRRLRRGGAIPNGGDDRMDVSLLRPSRYPIP